MKNIWKNLFFIFFSETARPKACICGMQQCHVELYINPAVMHLGSKMAPPKWSLASMALQKGKKTQKNSLKPKGPEFFFYFVCSNV